MRHTTRFKALVLFSLVFVTAFAFAANSIHVQISAPIQLNGTELGPGDYKVAWTAEGEKATVILSSGKTKVTADAKVVENAHPMTQNAVVRDDNNQLKRVLIGGKKTALVFAE